MREESVGIEKADRGLRLAGDTGLTRAMGEVERSDEAVEMPVVGRLAAVAPLPNAGSVRLIASGLSAPLLDLFVLTRGSPNDMPELGAGANG